jgi:hypothetical protein
MIMGERSDKEILAQTNALARELYRLRGYVAPNDCRFDLATHPHEVEAWNGACIAQHANSTRAISSV